MTKTVKIIIGVGIVLLILLAIANYVVGFKIGFANAKVKYVKNIQQLEETAALKDKTIQNILKQSAAQKESYIKEADTLKKEHQEKVKALTSKSAADLKKANATTEEILIEKEKDEELLIAANKTIEGQEALIQNLLNDWSKWENKLTLEWQERLNTERMKYEACQKWSDTLEKSLIKKTGFLPTLEKVAIGIAIGAVAVKVL